MNVPVEFLRECFEYNASTGLLWWKERPLSHFPGEAGFKIFNAQHSGRMAGTPHNGGYLMVGIRYQGIKTGLMVHRIAWALTHGEWPELLDHANRRKTDNRIANIRKATPEQNAWNATRKAGKFPVGVVGPGRRKRLYSARIKVDGRFKYLGTFSTPNAAHEAYAKARDELHGEFSVARI